MEPLRARHGKSCRLAEEPPDRLMNGDALCGSGPAPDGARPGPPKLILVSQEVRTRTGGSDREDALEHVWARFLGACGCLACPAPNQPAAATEMLRSLPVDGVLLTSGGDLVAYGGEAPERDRTEAALVMQAMLLDIPVVAVGRGMQLIQRIYGVDLKSVEPQASPHFEIVTGDACEEVDCEFRVAAATTAPDLDVWARSKSGLVMGVEDAARGIVGMMWRPERMTPFRDADMRLISKTFNAEPARKEL